MINPLIESEFSVEGIVIGLFQPGTTLPISFSPDIPLVFYITERARSAVMLIRGEGVLKVNRDVVVAAKSGRRN